MVTRSVVGKWPLLGIAAILIVALVGALVTTQLRAHGGDPDAVHTCVNDSSGVIKVVDPDEGCKNNETAVDLSTAGGAIGIDVSTFCNLEWRILEGPGDIEVSETCAVFDITTLDSDGFVGFFTSVAVGIDGFPVISYQDSSNGDLKVAHCTDAACTGTPDLTTVDSAGRVGAFTSVAVGTDGFPVISYQDDSNGDLKVAHCTDPACTSLADITILDSVGYVGAYTSVAIGTDGFPVISYHNSSFPTGELKVAHCNDAACIGPADITTVDSSGFVGLFTSLSIGTDGFPVISYQDGFPTNDLKVAHCTSADCTGPVDVTTVDSSGRVGWNTSMAIGTDVYPVISYWDGTNNALKVAHCTDLACTVPADLATVDSAGFVGFDNSLAIGSDGFPVISYSDETGDGALKAAHCTDLACTGTVDITSVDITGFALFISLAVGTDGFPVISYQDNNNGDLKVAHCRNVGCTNPFLP